MEELPHSVHHELVANSLGLASLNEYLFEVIHGFVRSGGLGTLAAWIAAEYLVYLVLLGVALFVLARCSSWTLVCRHVMTHLFVAAVAAWGLTKVTKFLLEAPRPFVVLADSTPLFTLAPFDAFPSGHATISMGLAMAMLLHDRARGFIYLVAALVIGWGRVAAGVHWPIDVVAGWLMGLLVVWGTHQALAVYTPDTQRKLK